MFSLSKLSKRIKINEGFKNFVYKDQLGNHTIGYGHLITPLDNYSFNKKYSKKILAEVFLTDLNNSIINFKKHYKRRNLPANIQEVIIEMIFQLGIKKVLRFKKFNKNINEKKYFLAAFEMINSKWYDQTPKRVEKLICILLNKNAR